MGAKITGSKTTKAAEAESLRKARTSHHVGVGQLFTQPNAHAAREEAKRVLEEALAAGVDGREEQDALDFVKQSGIEQAQAAVSHVRPTAEYVPARRGRTVAAPVAEVKGETMEIKVWDKVEKTTRTFKVAKGLAFATDKQAKWMLGIALNKQLPAGATLDSLLVRLQQGFAKRAASQFIDTYKDLPDREVPVTVTAAMAEAIAPGADSKELETVEVPAGVYGIHHEGEVKCYVVDHGKGRWAGYIFVNRISSDDRFPIKNKAERERILAAIRVDVEGAEVLAATTLRRCRRCGRGLSDTKNPYLEMGLGPECGSK